MCRDLLELLRLLREMLPKVDANIQQASVLSAQEGAFSLVPPLRSSSRCAFIVGSAQPELHSIARPLLGKCATYRLDLEADVNYTTCSGSTATQFLFGRLLSDKFERQWGRIRTIHRRPSISLKYCVRPSTVLQVSTYEHADPLGFCPCAARVLTILFVASGGSIPVIARIPKR